MKKLKIVDFDEVLKHSAEDQETKEIYVNDIRDELETFFDKGYPLGESCHIKSLDGIFSWRKGFLYCFSGYPQSGKSEMVNWQMILRAKHYKSKTLLYSPESDTKELITNLVRAYIGQNVNPEFSNVCSKEDYDKGLDFIHDHFVFIENEDEMPSIKTLLDVFHKFSKKGYEFFVIDPLNWVVESTGENNLYNYLKLTLTSLKLFARTHNVCSIYIEHPKTPTISNKTGLVPRANSFSLAGGSMHFNKCDCIVILHRLTKEEIEDKVSKGEILSSLLENDKENCNFVEWETVKMKSQRLNGKLGSQVLQYDFTTGRFV